MASTINCLLCGHPVSRPCALSNRGSADLEHPGQDRNCSSPNTSVSSCLQNCDPGPVVLQDASGFVVSASLRPLGVSIGDGAGLQRGSVGQWAAPETGAAVATGVCNELRPVLLESYCSFSHAPFCAPRHMCADSSAITPLSEPCGSSGNSTTDSACLTTVVPGLERGADCPSGEVSLDTLSLSSLLRSYSSVCEAVTPLRGPGGWPAPRADASSCDSYSLLYGSYCTLCVPFFASHHERAVGRALPPPPGPHGDVAHFMFVSPHDVDSRFHNHAGEVAPPLRDLGIRSTPREGAQERPWQEAIWPYQVYLAEVCVVFCR